MDQETYLKEVSTREVVKRGLKKFLAEITSVKFCLLVFVCIGIAMKWVSDTVGLGAALVIVGLREVPVDMILMKLRGKSTE
jgi:hypothetical protein